MFAELINNKLEMADLEVYYKAADRLIQGSDLYRDAEQDIYEHYVYKYSPPAALLFVPLLPFGFTLAKYIYWLLLTFILGSVLYNVRTCFKVSQKVYISLILGILVCGAHFYRELHLGQVNLLLLGIYVYGLILLKNKRRIAFAAIISLSIFIKPFALIFIPLLLIMGRWKELLYMLGFAFVYLAIPLLFYLDINIYLGLYQSWFEELYIELGDKLHLMAAGNHTIFSVLARFTPLAYLNLGGLSRNLFQFLVMIIMGLILLWAYYRRPVPDRDERLYIVLIAFIPLFAYTSYNAFIFTLPLVLFVMFRFRELSILFRILFILSCILIGANIYDIMGRELYNFLWGISVYTWGTLGLLFTLFLNWNRFAILKLQEKRVTKNE
jgi:hypothetical protein